MRWIFRCLLVITVCFGFVAASSAQKQLIVLKNEKVLLRLYAGDEFVFSLKGSKRVRRSYVNNLFDTAVVAHRDVVPLHRLDKIYFKRGNLLNVVGGLLVVGGAGYFIIDQVNVVLVQKQDASIDSKVALSSAAMVATGLPLMLMKKNHVKLRGKYRVLVVDKGSGFYMPDMRHDEEGY